MRLHPRVWEILRSRRTKIILACSPFILALLVALAYPVSTWLGRRSVERFMASMRDQGYVTNAAAYFSPSGPAEENYFLHPAALAEQEKSGSIVKDLKSFEPPLPGISRRLETGEPALARRADLRTWITPPMADEAGTARHLLAAIEPSSRRLDELREALKRPRAEWPLDGSLGTGTETIEKIVRSQFRLRPVADFAADEAYLHLALGDSARAAADVAAMFECNRLYLSSKPTIVALLLHEALSRGTTKLIWEGIARSSWNEAQLASFESALARENPQSALIQAFRGEAALLEIWASRVSSLESHDQGANLLKGWDADLDRVGQRLRGIWCELRPIGFVISKHVRSQRALFGEMTLPDGSARQRFEPEDLARFRSTLDSLPQAITTSESGATHTGRDIDAEAWGMLRSLSTTVLRAEATIALTRTGIALERYRLQHGTHPASLQELVPAYLPSILLDPFTRQPLHYRLQADGSPQVWSIGANLTDEGGLAKRDRDQGDLIWITRPIPGYTEKEFRKP